MDVSEHIMGILQTLNKKNPKEDWSFSVERQGNYVQVRFNNYHSRDEKSISRSGVAKLEGSLRESLHLAFLQATSSFYYEIGGDGDKTYQADFNPPVEVQQISMQKQPLNIDFSNMEEVKEGSVDVPYQDGQMIVINFNKV